MLGGVLERHDRKLPPEKRKQERNDGRGFAHDGVEMVTQIVEHQMRRHSERERREHLRLASNRGKRDHQKQESRVAKRPRAADEAELRPSPSRRQGKPVVERLVDEVGHERADQEPATWETGCPRSREF